MKVTLKCIDPDRFPVESPLRATLPPVFQEIDARFRRPEGLFVLAADWSGPIVVTACGGYTRLTSDTCEIRRLVVLPDFQGGGIGAMILSALLAEARQAGYRRMRVMTPQNVPALAGFYRAKGFAEIPPYVPAAFDEFHFLERAL